MSSDYTCPYCQQDGMVTESMSEDEWAEVECRGCGETFVVTASVLVLYNVSCAPGKHDLRLNEKHPGWYNCSKCDSFLNEVIHQDEFTKPAS